MRWLAFNIETQTILNIRYKGSRHPISTDPAELLTRPLEGGNCELVTHGITLGRGYRLPRVRSSELFADRTATQHVATTGGFKELKTGDIIGLGRKEQNGLRGVHQGVIYKYEELYVVHTTPETGLIMQPLEEAQASPTHAKVIWVKRPKPEEFRARLYSPKKLALIGLDFLVA